MNDNKNISLAKVPRNLKFPFRVLMLGYNNSSPAIEKVNGVFPGRIEFNIRLRGKGTAKMKLVKQHYECGYPHAFIKMPDAEYFSGCRGVLCLKAGDSRRIRCL